MRKRGSESSKPSPKATPEHAIIKQIIRLEKRVWEAAQRRDPVAFEQLVPADGIMIFQSGIVTQPEYLATMTQRTISQYRLGNIRGFMPNRQTVVIFYEAIRIGEENGSAFPDGTVIESTTWIKRGKKWVAILNQETPITPEKRSGRTSKNSAASRLFNSGQ
jgi:hypothetical protein